MRPVMALVVRLLQLTNELFSFIYQIIHLFISGIVSRANSIENAVDLSIKLKLLLVAFKLHLSNLLIQLRFRLELLVFSSSLDSKYDLNIEKTSLTIGDSSRSKDLGVPVFSSAASPGVGMLDEILNVRSRKQL